MSTKPEVDRINWLIEKGKVGQPEPKAPEPLVMLRRLKYWNVLYRDGGYENQYFVQMQEFDAVAKAELEFESILAFNRKGKR